MSWIDRLSPLRKGGAAVAEAVREEEGDGSKNGPPLFCLVNDASGRASFKTHVFPDSESATEFVLYWFPNESSGGLTAFWAMTHLPELDTLSDTVAEPLVMVRDLSREGVVYLFSFTDMDAAHAFLRDEVRHGTDLSAMMLYWAVPVRMAADPWGNMKLSPALPPGVVQELTPETSESDKWSPPPVLDADTYDEEAVRDARLVFEEAPNALTGVTELDSPSAETFELTSWIERASRKSSYSSEPSPASAPSGKAPRKRSLRRSEASYDPDLERVPEVFEWIGDTAPSLPKGESASTIEETPLAPSFVEKELLLPAQDVHPAVEAAPAPDGAEEVIDDEPEVLEENVVVFPETPSFDEKAKSFDEPIAFDAPAEEPASAVQMSAGSAPAHQAADDSAASAATHESDVPPAEDIKAQEATHPVDDVHVDVAAVSVHTNGNGQANDAGDHNGHVTTEPTEVVVRQNGHSTRKPAPARTDPAPEAKAEKTPVRKTKSDDDEGLDIRIEIHLRSSRNLKVKRWEGTDEPFEGFNSPPGRF